MASFILLLFQYILLQAFADGAKADSILRRHRRANTGLFEEFLNRNVERECMEENCVLEEAREAFENDEKTMEFWASYVDGDQCKSSPCQNWGTCEDQMGTYTCNCLPGYVGKNCEIVTAKMCDVDNGGCEHFCVVMESHGTGCQCASGYRLKEDGFTCEPIVNAPKSRIVGGNPALPGEIPWQVALVAHSTQQVFCGGSILKQSWVITAAHCLGSQNGSFYIRVGEHDVSKTEGTEQNLNITRFISHPRYDSKSGSLATVSGWGCLRFQGRSAVTLQKVELLYVDRTVCKESSSDLITYFMFCAGYSDSPKDACQGDSGGPHAMRYHNTWFLTGIVSWGEECAKKGKYSVYTQVGNYYRWIQHIIRVTKGVLLKNVDL
ncbi:coagulation factor IX-like [Sinocyclocheilus rhinocerous]|uniref:coagulation factor IX-like n=1 Tax=Sinocyclocheilus rhinocerous TaxID=307959 RepID=UPI0007B9A754|nr:PREDICTED: coagulation factor IX-like [Sinocyclocheilus rhinocerous]